MSNSLSAPLTLPNGQVVPNRLMKSAMSEALATPGGQVTPELIQLYRRWAAGGIGLLVTGNVMVDKLALGEPGNVWLEDERDLDALGQWARAAKSNGALVYMQLNHPGRQVPRFLNPESVAPSEVPFEGDLKAAFATPRALTAAEIDTLVAHFATAAAVAEKAGFDGVQIHGAHGYLVSQFLSPHTNRRTDRWGGSAEGRRAFLLAIIDAIRASTGPDFGLAVKINSADFQRGGITEDEAMDTVAILGALGLAFIEVSGGTYEAPAMVVNKKSTLEREAYFLAFAESVRDRIPGPLVVTGGFRSGPAMTAALDSGAVNMVGMARVLAAHPDFPNQLLADPDARVELPALGTGIHRIDKSGMPQMVWFARQLHRMGHGREPRPTEGPLIAMAGHFMSQGWNAFKPRRA